MPSRWCLWFVASVTISIFGVACGRIGFDRRQPVRDGSIPNDATRDVVTSDAGTNDGAIRDTGLPDTPPDSDSLRDAGGVSCAADPGASCTVGTVIGLNQGTNSFQGDLSSTSNVQSGSCASPSGRDFMLGFNALSDGTWRVDTTDSTVAHAVYVRAGLDCAATEVVCEPLAPGHVFEIEVQNGDDRTIVVDGAPGRCGQVAIQLAFIR
ncbi:MAG: hypothetical protein AAGF12_09555 [Myxococcota bacterium]